MRESLSVSEAQQAILDHTPVLANETVAVRDAIGRPLAAAVASPRTLPPADPDWIDIRIMMGDALISEAAYRAAILHLESVLDDDTFELLDTDPANPFALANGLGHLLDVGGFLGL